MENTFKATYTRPMTENVILTSEQMKRLTDIMVETFVKEVDCVTTSTDDGIMEWPPEIRWALFNAVVHEMSKDEVWRRDYSRLFFYC